MSVRLYYRETKMLYRGFAVESNGNRCDVTFVVFAAVFFFLSPFFAFVHTSCHFRWHSIHFMLWILGLFSNHTDTDLLTRFWYHNIVVFYLVASHFDGFFFLITSNILFCFLLRLSSFLSKPFFTFRHYCIIIHYFSIIFDTFSDVPCEFHFNSDNRCSYL